MHIHTSHTEEHIKTEIILFIIYVDIQCSVPHYALFSAFYCVCSILRSSVIQKDFAEHVKRSTTIQCSTFLFRRTEGESGYNTFYLLEYRSTLGLMFTLNKPIKYAFSAADKV